MKFTRQHAQRTRRLLRQMHLWLSPADYSFVQKLARSHDETVSRMFRRIIRGWKSKINRSPIGTTQVPRIAIPGLSGDPLVGRQASSNVAVDHELGPGIKPNLKR